MASQKLIFITGTDTDVGKTICSKALLQAAYKQGLSTLAYKPIAAGCQRTELGLRNDDALILQGACSIDVSYQSVNPITFEPPIAPHIAAELENSPIDIDLITLGLENLQQQKSELIIVEGAGGWRLPLNNELMLSDWVFDQGMSVILVVGMKLGCLNHALLTYESIVSDGLNVVGWIANQVQADMDYYQHNVSWLKNKIDVPMIAEIPYLTNIQNIDLSGFVHCDLKNLT